MENRDKIFDNNFDSPDFEILPNFSFNLDPSWTDSKSEEEKIHYQLISTTIHELVINSRFKKFNEIDEHGRNTKLKKVEINDVYGYVVGEMVKNYSRIDIFSEMCTYFDINPTKFYNSLSNVYKEDLIEELDRKTGILDRKNINKLF
jgi:hypothetical protein